MTFYSDLAADADAILTEFGLSVTLSHSTPGTYDPSTGTVTSTTTTQTGTGAVFDFGLHQSGASFTAGSMIVAGDKQLLLSPLKTDGTAIIAPVPGDLATIGGTIWTIAGIKSTAPAGEAVLYECLLRK
ncbi:MAG: hypothetical protein WA191_06815 [Telluria sp.]